MRSSRREPLITAGRVSPGARPWARVKVSMTTTSSSRPASGRRPERRYRPLSGMSRSPGIEIRVPTAGSGSPGIGSITFSTTRVWTTLTPGTSAMRSATDSGARLRLANTSAKR